jgi:hypothetical protein
MDVGALRLAETMELVATGLDVNIAVAVTESFGACPHDSHHRAVRVLTGVWNQAHTMEVNQSVPVAKEVQLHPWDGQRDKTKATYTFRLLQAPPDHIDYDAGQEMWLAALVAQIQAAYPADGNQWGEVHHLDQPRASGTQAEFEDGAKACLTLLGRQGTTRLQNYVTNFHAARQLSIERAERSKADAAAEALQAAKTQEEERVKAEKATPIRPVCYEDV